MRNRTEPSSLTRFANGKFMYKIHVRPARGRQVANIETGNAPTVPLAKRANTTLVQRTNP